MEGKPEKKLQALGRVYNGVPCSLGSLCAELRNVLPERGCVRSSYDPRLESRYSDLDVPPLLITAGIVYLAYSRRDKFNEN
jgi:hypothetical protein